MRAAIISDIHGNLTALEAVLADLRKTAPDLILHGGDLAGSGSNPAGVVDLIQSLGWPGVIGNTDEMLATPDSFEIFASQLPALDRVWGPLREMAAFTRDQLGDRRLAWLRALPQSYLGTGFALVHASPEDRWRSPLLTATDAELSEAYRDLPRQTIVYGHIHTPFVRHFDHPVQRYIANSGSVGQPYDGDPRASYLIVDGHVPSIRRVEYDLDRECRRVLASGLPYARWVQRIIAAAAPQMPEPEDHA